MKKSSYTKEFKDQAVALAMDKNYTRKQAADRLGIKVGVLDSWLHLHRKQENESCSAEELALKKRIAELERENKRLTMERDILKKATAYFAKDHQ